MKIPRLKTKKAKRKEAEETRVAAVVQNEMTGYIRKEELEECLAEIKKDEDKRKLWESLSPNKKLKILRYAMVKKGKEHDKKGKRKKK